MAELLASAGLDNTIRLWKAASGAPTRHAVRSYRIACVPLAFSPDGKTLASGGDDRAIRLWDVATGDEISSAADRPHRHRVLGRLRTGREDTVFRRRRQDHQALGLEEGRLRATWRAEDAGLRPGGLAGRPNPGCGKPPRNNPLVGRGPADRPAYYCKVAMWATCSASRSVPMACTLASAGRDQSVRLWDPVTGQEVLDPQGA